VIKQTSYAKGKNTIQPTILQAWWWNQSNLRGWASHDKLFEAQSMATEGFAHLE